MRNNFLLIIMLFSLLFSPCLNFAQTADFGSLANFVLFTSAGALGNTGVSQINGNIGSHVGAINGFETPTYVNGTIYNADGVTAQGVADLQVAYNVLSSIPTTNSAHAPAFGSGETLLPGVYAIAGAGSLAGVLTLDAQGDANALFIFKFQGAFTSGAASTLILSNGASACNVFWVAEGAIAMATLTTMKGTLIAHPGAASMGANCNLEGRMFSTAGAVSVYELSATVPTACSVTATWTGNEGTSDWFTPGNWLGGVPRSTTTALIPGTLLAGNVFPVIDTGIAKVNSLTIKIAASVIVTATLQVNGAIINNGILNVKDGTVEMAGSSDQTIYANTFINNTIKNLIISNNVTLSGEDTITGSLAFGNVNNKVFNSAGFLTLKSTAAGTANIADVTNAGYNSGNTIDGDVEVERYIPAFRAWRLITSPINMASSQTINEAWQEGVDPMDVTDPDNGTAPGFGTHITGGLTTNGFDQGVNANPGIKKFENGTWVALSSTHALINSEPGYMLFVRGDRSIDLSQGINATPTNTVLRSAGILKTGNQTFVAATTGFTLIGNPFASRIDFHTIGKGTAPDTYYLWDPKLTGSSGAGGYTTFTWNGSGYSASPVPASRFNFNGGIESGTAFFVDNTAGNAITIKETDKISGSASVFRPLNAPEQLRTNLYIYNADGTKSLKDGVLFLYSRNYSNAVDFSDARKIIDVSENLGIKNASAILCIEKRQPLTSMDTIQFTMTAMKAKSYKLEFIAENLVVPGLTGFLEDSYLNTSTPVNLSDTTTFNFTIANVPGSWNPTRFRIVFKQLTVLPVFFTNVKAIRQFEGIKVVWNVNDDINIKQFHVERSVNGFQFEEIASVTPTANSNRIAGYNWMDHGPLGGNNFYRIKSITGDGVERYSSVVKVSIENNKPAMLIYPNPVTNNIIRLQFTGMPAGIYSIKLISNLGQVVREKKILHTAETGTEVFQLNKNLVRGIYNLTVVKPDNSILSTKLFY